MTMLNVGRSVESQPVNIMDQSIRVEHDVKGQPRDNISNQRDTAQVEKKWLELMLEGI